MIRVLCISALFLMLSSMAWAQETPVIGQYLFNDMLINPAATGSQDAFNVQLGYRRQWFKVEGAPVTKNFSAQLPVKNKMGVGILVYQDEVGVTNQSGIFANYAYQVKIKSKQFLRFGLSGGVTLNRINYSELQLTDPGDQSFAQNTPTGVQPNFSFGVRYQLPNLKVGLSIPLILGNSFIADQGSWNMVYGRANRNVLLRTVYNFNVSEEFSILLGGLLKYHPEMKSQTDLTLVAEFKSVLELGAGYRSREGILVMSKINLNSRWNVGLQYEIPTTKYYNYRAGSLELLLIYQSLFETKATSPRKL